VRAGREIAQHIIVNDDLATSTAELLSILAGLREHDRAKDE